MLITNYSINETIKLGVSGKYANQFKMNSSMLMIQYVFQIVIKHGIL